jgi:Zn-dependent protease
MEPAVLLFGNLSIEAAIMTVLAVLIGMTVHEFAHNYVGHLMGDPVPAREGRLTLNPLVHINPVGFLMFVLIGFGILGQAPISPYRMRNPRWGFLAAVAAGPLSNLLLAVIAGILLRLLESLVGFNSQAALTLANLFFYIIFWNVLLFVFNLLPFFPIDGWTIVLAFLPADLARWWERNAMYSQYALFALILIGFVLPGVSPLSSIIFGPAQAITRILTGF